MKVNMQAHSWWLHSLGKRVYCRIFLPLKFKGVAYAYFISDLLSVVFAEYTELIRLFEMEFWYKLQFENIVRCGVVGYAQDL